MLRESVSAFSVDGIDALTDDQFIECFRGVHDYCAHHGSERVRRQLVPRSGPQTVVDRHTVSVDYMGGCNHVFRYFHVDVFAEELRCFRGDLRPETAPGRDFVLAVQHTHNRMMNWNVCRQLSAFELSWDVNVSLIDVMLLL